ncbi:CATRA system-associated protein [Streptomyces sp. MS06]|uniref:CATRA system-associated protein n=1 Tax=Streptomyces sp. MS06 TaxID=3385974 RepID=UPI0039A00D76
MPRGLWNRGKDDDPARAAAVRDEAAELLRSARDWELTPTRWSVLEEILDSVSAAEAVGDLKGLARATRDLRLLDPLRLTPLGPPPPDAPVRTQASDRTRERLNVLVHRLSSGKTERNR